ncbi:MAG: putative glycoside hydrolase [Faecalibacterium sp.]|jgi:hypothetical protein|nr:putative glycoside hydrolase [Faecalibacterium sp.]
MAKKNSMGKVKRYRHSFYSGRLFLAKKAIAWVVGIAALFAVGFLAAPAVLNWGTHVWYTKIKGLNLSQSTSVAESEPASSAASSEAASTASEQAASTPTAQIGEGSWTTLSLAALGDQTAIDQAAADLATQGVHYGVVPLKDASGYIYYASAVPNAAKSIAATTIDASATAAALKAKGIVPVAYLCAFQDPLSAYTDRTMAIHYGGSDYLWLDAASDAGGKPWLNPYADTAVQYIGDLIEEAYNMGYEQVILSTAQFPAYVGAKQDFGDTQGRDRAAQLTQDFAAWETRFDGRVTLWYEVSYANCAAPGTALGDSMPGALGVENLMIQLPAESDTSAESAASASAPGGQAVTLEDVVQAMKDNGCAYVVVRDGTTGNLA